MNNLGLILESLFLSNYSDEREYSTYEDFKKDFIKTIKHHNEESFIFEEFLCKNELLSDINKVILNKKINSKKKNTKFNIDFAKETEYICYFEDEKFSIKKYYPNELSCKHEPIIDCLLNLI